MRIRTADGREIARRGSVARGIWRRFRGLMGVSADEFPPESALVIDPCSSIHMFFMRFPIDVLYVDRDDRVVRVQEGLKPWRIGPLYSRGAKYVVELPSGTVESSGVAVGDQLVIELDQ